MWHAVATPARMSYCGQNGMPPTSSPLDLLLAVLKSPALSAEFAPQTGLWSEIKRLAEIHRFSGMLAHSASSWLPPSERPWRDGVLMSHHHRHTQRLQALQILIEAFRCEGCRLYLTQGASSRGTLLRRPFSAPFQRSGSIDLRARCAVGCPRHAETGISAGKRLSVAFAAPRQSTSEFRRHRQFAPSGSSLSLAGRWDFHRLFRVYRSQPQLALAFGLRIEFPVTRGTRPSIRASTRLTTPFTGLRWLYDVMAIAR